MSEISYTKPANEWLKFRPQDRSHFVLRRDVDWEANPTWTTACGKRLKTRFPVRVIGNEQSKCPKCLSAFDSLRKEGM